MTLDNIARIIAEQHGGAWWALFRETAHGHRFLPTGDVLNQRAYDAIRRRFSPTPPAEESCAEESSAADRRRNRLRAIADRADGAA